MTETSYSARYLAERITLLNGGDSPERIGRTLFNAKISLNPHQIQAALFAFTHPTLNGVMLCDEVGLGKTIEAGIVISQYWCERKRNILIISPASLTKQWANELEDKFNIKSVVADRKYYNIQIKKGDTRPFEGGDKIIIASLNFASSMFEEIRMSKIDLVIIDEAHKLRNVYNEKSIVANNVKNAVGNFKKILLTATPIQNNLMELYGLSTIIDEKIFGDKEYFKNHYIKDYEQNKYELKNRLDKFIHRTLRNQVDKYIKFPKRIVNTFEFEPTKEEEELYEALLDLVQSRPTYGVNNSQNQLISLILCKLMSSSTAAVLFTLEKIKTRIENILQNKDVNEPFLDDEMEDDSYEIFDAEFKVMSSSNIKDELIKVNNCITLANKVKYDKKANRLLEAINSLFSNVKEPQNKKIIIFTESTRTQKYLYDFLIKNGLVSIVMYNGSLDDPKNKEIYNKWLNNPKNINSRNNTKATNIRTAILEYFENEAEIMIATEAAAEGLNMQFCSTLINYDLPWNPQRVEQRIGRCHRYGQKNDVIIINFLNINNRIDKRVYELLNSKFKLFDDLFGASDEILGRLDIDSSFDREILNIYLSCRLPKDIDDAFDNLQKKYEIDISNEMRKTRELLIDNFDEDLQLIFESILKETTNELQTLENDFFRICKYIFSDSAIFYKYGFELKNEMFNLHPGNYIISNNDKKKCNLTIDDKNGSTIIEACKNAKLEGCVQFNLSEYPYKIKELEKLKGRRGHLIFGKITIDSFEKQELLVLTGIDQDGNYLEKETCEKLFRLPSKIIENVPIDFKIIKLNEKNYISQSDSLVNKMQIKNNLILNDEISRIDDWANDKISGIELKVDNLRFQRKELQNRFNLSPNYLEKLDIQKEIDKITKMIKKLWLELADNEEEVEKRRSDIINKLKNENMKKITNKIIYDVSFEVV